MPFGQGAAVVTVQVHRVLRDVVVAYQHADPAIEAEVPNILFWNVEVFCAIVGSGERG